MSLRNPIVTGMRIKQKEAPHAALPHYGLATVVFQIYLMNHRQEHTILLTVKKDDSRVVLLSRPKANAYQKVNHLLLEQTQMHHLFSFSACDFRIL